MSAFLVLRWLSLLVDVAVKSAALLTAAGLFHLLLRRASAAWRHLVWLLAIGGLLSLPVLSATLPEWRVRAWPHLLPAIPTIAPEAAYWPGVPRVGSRGTLPTLVRMTRLALPPVGHRNLTTGSLAARPLARLALTGEKRHRPAILPPPLGLFLIWLAGAGAVLAQVLTGMAHVRRLERRCRRVTEGPLAALTGELSQMLGLRRPVTLLKSRPDTGPIVPMTWGWRWPSVLLPADSEEWPEIRLRSVLLHELAHVQRQDWPAQLLTCLTTALYWFHPLVWLAARQLRIESERACDDCVLTAGVRPADYASHLLEIVRSVRGNEGSLRAALSMVPKSPIELRVRAILERRHDRRQTPRWAALPAALIVCGAVIALAAVRPDEAPLTTRTSGQTVLISVVPQRMNGGHIGRSHKDIWVAILERNDRPALPPQPGKRRTTKAPRDMVRVRPVSPREQHLPRPELPASPRPRSRPSSPNRFIAAAPETHTSRAAGPPSPLAETEPTSEPESERPDAAPAAGTVLAAFQEPLSPDAGGDGDGARSTLTGAAQEGSSSSQPYQSESAVLLASQTASPSATPLVEGPDPSTEPHEPELQPDTDVLPVTGQDRDALTAPSDAPAAQPASPGTRPLGASDPGPARLIQAVEDGDATILATELLIWDRTRQCWERVVLVWNGTLANPAPPEQHPEDEGIAVSNPGSGLTEPGSLDEELWFWDRMFERSEQDPAEGQQSPEHDRQRPPCVPTAV